MASTGLGRYSGTNNYDFPRGPVDDYLPRKPATMKYGMSMLDQVPSDEEVIAARSSLKLLKSKMKESNGFPTMPANNYGSNTKQKGYFEEVTHEYMPHAPGDRRLDQDQNYNDVYQNPNNNYRKVFKPNIGNGNGNNSNDGYQPMGMGQGDRSDARKSKALAQVNTYAPRDNYNTDSYGGGPASNMKAGGKPPMGGNKYEPRGGDGYGQGANEDFSDFSAKNVPSRIPKNTLAMNKAKAGQPQSAAYEDDFGAPSKPKFGNRNYESESPTIRGYQQQNQDDTYGGGYASQQRAPSKALMPKKVESEGYGGAKGYGNQNKGWQNNAQDDHQEKEDSYKDFTKPSFKKVVSQPAVEERQKNKAVVHAIPNDPEDRGSDDGPLIECPQGCGRSFFQHALEKHAKICVKVFQKKRKQFNSADQRTGDEEVETNTRSNYPPPKKGAAKPGKPGASGKAGMGATGGKWKQESEAFRANLRAARGGKLTKEQEAAVAQASSAGMVQCDSCGRKFNENAAARHIPFCQTKNKIDTIKKGGKPGKR